MVTSDQLCCYFKYLHSCFQISVPNVIFFDQRLTDTFYKKLTLKVKPEILQINDKNLADRGNASHSKYTHKIAKSSKIMTGNTQSCFFITGQM